MLNTARTNTFRVRKVDWEDTGGVWARCFHIPEVVPPPKADVHLLPRRKGEYACQEQHCRHRYSLGLVWPRVQVFLMWLYLPSFCFHIAIIQRGMMAKMMSIVD